MDIVLYCLAIVIAAVITGLLGYFMVPFLHKIKFGQTIREVGPSWHKNKQGTPTMGGLMFIIGSSVAAERRRGNAAHARQGHGGRAHGGGLWYRRFFR